MIDRTSAARLFTRQDQETFAVFSGDRNPMHMDEGTARRTQAGACVVHGIHSCLWALESMAAGGTPMADLAALKVEFTQFLEVGRAARLEAVAVDSAHMRAEIHGDGVQFVRMDLRFGRQALDVPTLFRGPPAAVPDHAVETDFSSLAGSAGWVEPPSRAEGHARALFPHACAALGTKRIVAVGLLSSLVGMVVPGLHSIFSGFSLDLIEHDDDTPGLGFSVQNADHRFRLVTINICGPGFKGKIKAFARFPPVAPPSITRAAEVVRHDEFASRRALVVGGSRGIGAATVKLLAAGGGTVALTYRSGRAEAEAILEEITRARGTGSCSIWPYDAAADPAPQLDLFTGPFTHIYYFATTRIFAASGGWFDSRRLDEFLRIYVEGFAGIVGYFLARYRGKEFSVFYPSSVAVEARPRGMTEYAMAKAAGEILCADLMRAQNGLVITAPRLPRILTDQTATVPPVPAADPFDVMLPLLRAERG